jgi:hypothetical protein
MAYCFIYNYALYYVSPKSYNMVILGKIVTKKIKAYPKNGNKDYVCVICYDCKSEYLTQGVINNEKHKCPSCNKYRNYGV